MAFDVIIPARYAANRLPGKPLIEIAGKPLIQWVFESASKSAAVRIMVATDDERIKRAVEGFGGSAYMTRSDHESGTDRIAELAAGLGIPGHGVVVNVQGDEPAMPAALINQVAKLLLDDASARVGTACHAIRCSREFNDPNVVKVVRDRRGRALYFSRAPIPYTRDIGTGGPKGCRHIGIYSFRAAFLEEFTRWPMTELEQAERLEQLRILEHGVPIEVCDAVEPPGQGIDTPEDLERFSTWVSQHG